jgi:L-ascorbate metabolism protein UlaG (beta-lactamase superfamily)
MVLVAGMVAAAGLVAGARALDPGPPPYPLSAHFDGERFAMPGGGQVGEKSFADLLRWQVTRAPADWPKTVPVETARPPARVEGTELRATMVGHATVLVQTAGLNILTDPIWRERAGPVDFAGPKRVTAPGIAFDDLPRIDLVLVSHGHWDHLDLETLEALWRRDRPFIVVPLGHGVLLAERGIVARELDWGQEVTLGPARIIAEPVYHWTSRWFLDRNRALWAGFTVVLPGGNLYFAGDTGYGDGAAFRAVRRHGEVRLALLPVGAYAPRWFMAEQHMNPEEAVAAAQDLGARQAIGIHWGTFQLTDEGREAPRIELGAALARGGFAPAWFPALSPGETLVMEGDAGPALAGAPVASGG